MMLSKLSCVFLSSLFVRLCINLFIFLCVCHSLCFVCACVCVILCLCVSLCWFLCMYLSLCVCLRFCVFVYLPLYVCVGLTCQVWGHGVQCHSCADIPVPIQFQQSTCVPYPQAEHRCASVEWHSPHLNTNKNFSTVSFSTLLDIQRWKNSLLLSLIHLFTSKSSNLPLNELHQKAAANETDLKSNMSHLFALIYYMEI